MTDTPHSIDNYAFAKNGETLTGNLSLRHLNRLKEQLASISSASQMVDNGTRNISWKLAGSVDALGRAFLKLNIQSQFACICQRCLGEVPVAIHINLRYLLAQDADAIDDDDEEYDALEIDAVMDVNALIEDELLMAMPYAPKHENACQAATLQAGEKPNPFAVLKHLKQG